MEDHVHIDDDRTELDPDLAAIRSLMGATPQAAPKADPQPDPVAASEPAHVAARPLATQEPRRQAKPRKPSRLKPLALKFFHAIRARVRTFLARPDAPRIMALTVLAAIFIWRPLFVIGMALFTLIIALITYLSLGPDRVAQMVAAWFERLKSRDADRAEAIRARAARVSKVIARLVAKLPESWTQGLYLPDFEDAPELPPAMHDDPFDRLVPQSELR